MNEKMSTLSIANSFTRTPGHRSRADGDFSGEEFLEDVLLPAFRSAWENKEKLCVDLDGTSGYATSFLEASFGGLARQYPIQDVLSVLEFRSDDEPYLIEEVNGYIQHARDEEYIRS